MHFLIKNAMRCCKFHDSIFNSLSFFLYSAVLGNQSDLIANNQQGIVTNLTTFLHILQLGDEGL